MPAAVAQGSGSGNGNGHGGGRPAADADGLRLVKRTMVIPDWHARIHKETRLLMNLIATQAQLTGGGAPGEQVAEVLRQTVGYLAADFYGHMRGVADRRREEAEEAEAAAAAAHEGAGELAAALDDHGEPGAGGVT